MFQTKREVKNGHEIEQNELRTQFWLSISKNETTMNLESFRNVAKIGLKWS